MAEAVRFELTNGFPRCRFSRPLVACRQSAFPYDSDSLGTPVLGKKGTGWGKDGEKIPLDTPTPYVYIVHMDARHPPDATR